MNFKEKLENKKILVTGGAGFIGSNLVEKLLELGAVVTVLDNFATGHRHNIEPFFKNEKFTLIEGDIRDLETCKKACDGQDFVLRSGERCRSKKTCLRCQLLYLR